MWGQNSLLYFFNWISVWAANHLSLHVTLVLALFVNKPTEAIFFLFKKMVFFVSVTEYYTIILCPFNSCESSNPGVTLLRNTPYSQIASLHSLIQCQGMTEPVMDRNHIHVKVENSLWTINAAETKISSPRRWNPAFKLGPKQTSSILLSPSHTR